MCIFTFLSIAQQITQIQELKTTHIYIFTVLQVRSLGRLDCIFRFVSHEAKDKLSAILGSCLEALVIGVGACAYKQISVPRQLRLEETKSHFFACCQPGASLNFLRVPAFLAMLSCPFQARKNGSWSCLESPSFCSVTSLLPSTKESSLLLGLM